MRPLELVPLNADSPWVYYSLRNLKIPKTKFISQPSSTSLVTENPFSLDVEAI
ncbi:hypothetical protein CISIN_1g0418262mg, partial [Citrus sinensis]